MTPAAGLGAGDLTHGVLEGQTKNLDVEVDGIAGEIAIRPAPVAVFDNETGISSQNKNAGLARDELDVTRASVAPLGNKENAKKHVPKFHLVEHEL
jgi:hypothetical protein